MRGICLNWKVVGGLAVVGVGIWALAPEAIGAALPVLALLACPLSMLFMMRGMRGGTQQSGAACAMPAQKAASRETAEPVRAAYAGTREERLTQLKAELEQARERQALIARRVAELEISNSAVVRQAEEVAHSADRR